MKKEIVFLKSLGDARLAELVHEGNNAAFDVLMERHSPHLKEFLHHLLHHNANEKDVLQNTWLHVLTELRRSHYRENGQFTGWLNKITYNMAMNKLNCEKHYVRVSEEAMPEQSVLPMEGPDDREWVIRQVFKKMNITMKRVVYYYFKEKMSCGEIAMKIKSTPAAVSKTLCRAYIMIRKELVKMKVEKLFFKSAVKNRVSRIV